MRIQLTLLTLGLALVFLSGVTEGQQTDRSKWPSGQIIVREDGTVLGIGPLAKADEQPKQESPKATAKEANSKSSATAVLLTLPAELQADIEDGWVEVEATLNGEGEVRWMVSPRVKTRVVGNTLLVATTKPGTIVVTAIALVGGKLSQFQSCNVLVAGGSSPTPRPTPPGPTPAPPPVSSELFVSVIVDPALATMAEQQLALSPTLRNAVKAGSGTYNAFASTDPILQPASQQNPKDGKVVKAIKLPATEQGVLEALR